MMPHLIESLSYETLKYIQGDSKGFVQQALEHREKPRQNIIPFWIFSQASGIVHNTF